MAPAYVFYAVLTSMFLQVYGQSNCSDTSIISYCTNCQTQAICSVDSAETTFAPCASGKVCAENGVISTCSPPTDSSVCKCKSNSGFVLQCDAYNSSIVISCLNGAILNTKVCATDQVCLENGACGATTTSMPSTTMSVPTCNVSDIYPVPINCTAAVICSAVSQPPDAFIICKTGQIYSNKDFACIDYLPFSCSIDQPDKTGVFGDPYNCSLIHTCVAGDPTDSTSECPPNQVFNETLRQCVDNATAGCVSESCTPCKSDADVFPLDSSKCVRGFQQCVNNTNEQAETDSDDFLVEQRLCPPNGFNFDPKRMICSKSCSVT